MTPSPTPEDPEAMVPEPSSEAEACDGCGDVAFHFRDGWYCESCAACDFCDSPYCEDPSHAY